MGKFSVEKNNNIPSLKTQSSLVFRQEIKGMNKGEGVAGRENGEQKENKRKPK